MKLSAAILALFLALSGLAVAQAPAAAGGAIRLTKITRNLVATPEFTYSGDRLSNHEDQSRADAGILPLAGPEREEQWPRMLAAGGD